MATDLTQQQGETNREITTHTATDGESLSEAVIVALRKAASRTTATTTDQLDVGAIDPLFETIDPDALDALFGQPGDGTQQSGTVSFTHSGFEVTASGSGEVLVTRA
ncbi:HalOD1 output domain-containing protein [Halorientalis brevis]|uniref:HalOD1 output domain-containing protein n=1 Tax=Halorientalis brevis TaxID=1126241 RepID=A0ABD6CDY2_9EURY|nr:HalOD1 output domain-containing protein [Halorientalis brevis]